MLKLYYIIYKSFDNFVKYEKIEIKNKILMKNIKIVKISKKFKEK